MAVQHSNRLVAAARIDENGGNPIFLIQRGFERLFNSGVGVVQLELPMALLPLSSVFIEIIPDSALYRGVDWEAGVLDTIFTFTIRFVDQTDTAQHTSFSVMIWRVPGSLI